DDIRAEQVGVAESERLGSPIFLEFNRIERILIVVICGGSKCRVEQVSAEYRVTGTPLIVDPPNGHMIVFKEGRTVSEQATRIRGLRQTVRQHHRWFAED